MNSFSRYLNTFILLCICTDLFAAQIGNIDLPPPPGMLKSAATFILPDGPPKAFLVLLNGYNSDGGILIRQSKWLKFAKTHGFILVGPFFVSQVNCLKNGEGYYYPEKGSGTALLNILDRITDKQLPIYIYGFSGGAHFTSRFVEWTPTRVKAWCAYSAGWWDLVKSKPDIYPMGIVACGTEDRRYNATIRYFQDGRKHGRKWTWVALKHTSHTLSPELDNFVMAYFATILHNDLNTCIVDNLTLELTNIPEGTTTFNHSYLPSSKLFEQWRTLSHEK